MIKSALLKSIDIAQIVAVFLLVCIGLVTIYSATYESEGEISQLYRKQLMVALVSLVVFACAAAIPPRVYFVLSYVIYVFALFGLIAVLVIDRSSESARWIRIGSLNYQPSEVAKLAMILALARFLTDKKKVVDKFTILLRSLLFVVFPVLLVLVEPDLGTASVYFLIAIPILILGGVNLLYLLMVMMPVIILVCSFSIYILILALLLFFLALLKLKLKPIVIILVLIGGTAIGFSGPKFWNSLHPYQQQRIKTFLNPEADPHGAGYQIIQSKVAVGSGGLWGKGHLKGTQGHLKFLPARHTDFIFSVFCEEFGFAGAVLVLLAFYTLVYRGMKNAFRCRNLFNALVLIGCCWHFIFHAIINIGMTVGLFPVTGLPLPFISYGGSALIVNMTIAGIMISIGMRRWEY